MGVTTTGGGAGGIGFSGGSGVGVGATGGVGAMAMGFVIHGDAMPVAPTTWPAST